MADARRHAPPPKPFLGIGAAMLAVNHLSVAINQGVQAEALVMGCWLVLVGGWSLVAARWFDAVWDWVDRRGWRVIGFVLLTLFMALGTAEAVARVGYGQPLLG